MRTVPGGGSREIPALTQEPAQGGLGTEGAIVAEGRRAQGTLVYDGVGEGTAHQSLSPTVSTVAVTRSEMGTLEGFEQRRDET